MSDTDKRSYHTLANDEWDLFLEAYRSYEIQQCHQEIYLSGFKRNGDRIRRAAERRIDMLENADYQKLFADFGANFSESIEIELEATGDYNFFKLFDLMFTKKS